MGSSTNCVIEVRLHRW